MIDRTTLNSVNAQVSDLDAKNYEISALGDFISKVSGEVNVTCRINGQWQFQIPASLFTAHFAVKKAELEGDVAQIESDVVSALPALDAIEKEPVISVIP